MKKSQKIVLSIFSLGYLVGLYLLIWAKIIDEVFKFLAEFNIHLDFKSDLFIYYYGLVLALTVFVFTHIDGGRGRITRYSLKQTKEGRLVQNQGINFSLFRQSSGEDLSEH